MKTLLSSIVLSVVSLGAFAQDKMEQDAEAIKKMCGCYEVSFNFAETFQHVKDSLYKPSKNKVTGGLEWAQLVTDEDGMIQIQHLLQVGPPSQPMIVKHWRQDWMYENQDFYMYNADNEWSFVNKPKSEVEGQWTQKVYQVDDSPRYEGSATWVHVDGKSYWENTTPAPLPRREYTVRSDYNLTMRGNRQEITENGWIHDQDNQKIVREKGAEDVLIASEKGYNVYKRVDDSRCAAAQEWWKENYDKWEAVRDTWSAIYGRDKDLVLKEKHENKRLYDYLFNENLTEKKEIKKTIESFVESPAK
ncbi:hypothetical protein BST97_13890 [Nonlabens spongiae]|uniref:Uncharacterized protein n=1 Tax=Nonlabens spongiae TaxID=331648 RepID=A0A1W6MN26_9FLAO|nr:DUF6607 family protein [Nonlabens spongiae]ARN78991.1 hypothetical protein BST97_13890 [Nonlabens spongiae]